MRAHAHTDLPRNRPMTRQIDRLFFRPALVLAAALAGAPAAFADASPADAASPQATPARIRPLAGVLFTGTAGNNDQSFANPDGSTAAGSLSGRYEAFAGAEFPVDPDGLSLRLTAGVHTSANFRNSSGGSEHFTRYPLEATLWYPVNDKLRVGGGARYSMRARFSGPGGKTSDGLNATPALIFGIGYTLVPHLLLDARYVYERYEQGSGGSDVEASHWGLGLTAIY
jgi:Outer membrane protein beta-barrel domain